MLSSISGFFLPFQGLGVIFSPGLRRFVAIPLLLNVLIFAAVGYVALVYFETFINNWLPPEGWMPSQSWLAFLGWLLEFFRWILWLLFAVAYALALFYGFTLIANLIASPFNGILAARVEEKLTGTRPADADETLMKAIAPAVAGEVGKIVYFASRALPLLLLFFVPGLNILVSVAWVVFGLWFLAIEYADYPMGNHGLKPKAQRQHLRQNRLKSLAFGAGVTVMMLIPVLQLAAMPAAVAGATRLWVDDLRPR